MGFDFMTKYANTMVIDLILQNTNMNLWGPMRFEDLQMNHCSKKTAGGNNSALGIRSASLGL